MHCHGHMRQSMLQSHSRGGEFLSCATEEPGNVGNGGTGHHDRTRARILGTRPPPDTTPYGKRRKLWVTTLHGLP